jgi:hypothetical protein
MTRLLIFGKALRYEGVAILLKVGTVPSKSTTNPLSWIIPVA